MKLEQAMKFFPHTTNNILELIYFFDLLLVFFPYLYIVKIDRVLSTIF